MPTTETAAPPANGAPAAKSGADNVAVNDMLDSLKQQSDQKPQMPKKAPILSRRLSFTGRPIDIIRNACATMRNELVPLFAKWV